MKEAFFAPNIMRDIFGLLINHSWYVSRAPLASIVGLKNSGDDDNILGRRDR